jgi:hypothetical protein
LLLTQPEKPIAPVTIGLGPEPKDEITIGFCEVPEKLIDTDPSNTSPHFSRIESPGLKLLLEMEANDFQHDFGDSPLF